jgi:hypothetical protein
MRDFLGGWGGVFSVAICAKPEPFNPKLVLQGMAALTHGVQSCEQKANGIRSSIARHHQSDISHT